MLVLTTAAQAQGKSNIFQDRNFWASKPSIASIEQKIAEGNDPTELTSSGFDPVTSAIFANADLKTLKYLLAKKGNPINKLTHDGRTYLFWAASRGNLPLMKYLLANGAKTDILDDKGSSVLMFAAAAGQLDTKVYDLLSEHGFVIANEKNKSGASPLLVLIPKLKDFSLVSYFESKGLSLSDTDTDGNGAFNYTARTGNIEMLKKLIAKGVDYNSRNKKNGNAMIFASQGVRNGTNGLELFQFLEKLGIKPNITTTEGVNPLHAIASRSNDKKLIAYFLEKGVSINQQDKEGNTPFMNAASRNNLSIISYLMPRVKDINLQNKDGETALSKAVRSNSPAVINYLLSNKADASIKDKKGNSLVYNLVHSYNRNKPEEFSQKADILKKQGLKFNQVQAKNNSLYHIAIEKSDIALLKLLKPYQIDINATNDDGLTVLHIAAMKAKDTKILKYLLQEGANKQITTSFEETAYDFASENEILKKNNTALNFLK
ncbi:ankyrin repeat-containing protein [Polaribacter pacificus]|uniref:Ankyrin repeat-containing protein n=2 Tax=Polaribacter pacificus TaxID=1775173 RepID=A0A917MAW9_9FLAO|nr:ankyrin repeat-containing protein [Polaribacter pacificus]